MTEQEEHRLARAVGNIEGQLGALVEELARSRDASHEAVNRLVGELAALRAVQAGFATDLALLKTDVASLKRISGRARRAEGMFLGLSGVAVTLGGLLTMGREKAASLFQWLGRWLGG
jgi:hypothetical protein